MESGLIEGEVDGVVLRILPLDRVIASKRATHRAKDLAQLPALEATLLAAANAHHRESRSLFGSASRPPEEERASIRYISCVARGGQKRASGAFVHHCVRQWANEVSTCLTVGYC